MLIRLRLAAWFPAVLQAFLQMAAIGFVFGDDDLALVIQDAVIIESGARDSAIQE